MNPKHCHQPLTTFESGGFYMLHACKVCGYGIFTNKITGKEV